MLFISIFSRTNVEAKADRTKNEVETGMPFLVKKTKARGAKAWYHCGSMYGILVKRPKEISQSPVYQP